MIKFENTKVMGWGHAIRGMRNPLNSWDRSDSGYGCDRYKSGNVCFECASFDNEYEYGLCKPTKFVIGENDLDLTKRLRAAGTDHRKYLRMITAYVDITAPLYWWKEFDTYKIGTVANSCSTMHKIHEKEFTLEDFSCEHLDMLSTDMMIQHIIPTLNINRNIFIEIKDKKYWWQMIQLLPSSYNQKRTIMLNYEVLNSIYKSRKNHKLDEWSVGFINWTKSLPYAKELIIGDENV